MSQFEGVGAHLDTAPVAPTSQSAVSRISKSASLETTDRRRGFEGLPIWKSAIRQVGKPALPGGSARIRPRGGAGQEGLANAEAGAQNSRAVQWIVHRGFAATRSNSPSINRAALLSASAKAYKTSSPGGRTNRPAFLFECHSLKSVERGRRPESFCHPCFVIPWPFDFGISHFWDEMRSAEGEDQRADETFHWPIEKKWSGR
jgi:hypothetical protein